MKSINDMVKWIVSLLTPYYKKACAKI